jgi:hypothetical protein
LVKTSLRLRLGTTYTNPKGTLYEPYSNIESTPTKVPDVQIDPGQSRKGTLIHGPGRNGVNP